MNATSLKGTSAILMYFVGVLQVSMQQLRETPCTCLQESCKHCKKGHMHVQTHACTQHTRTNTHARTHNTHTHTHTQTDTICERI